MLPGKGPLLVLSAFIGGMALIGMAELGLTVVAALYGERSPIELVFGLFALGAAGSAGTMWLMLRKIEKDALKRLGLDK